ncbi:MAG TPA: PAS domain-containing protein [Phycisphaerae bacterium]|nr:PAS domain-containing protein [Phycisphaerae bacterium]
MSQRRTSVTVYVVVILAAAAMVLVGGGILVEWVSEKTHRESELASRLDNTADELEASLALPAWNFDRPQLEKIADAAMQGRDIASVAIRVKDVSSPGGMMLVARMRTERWLPVAADTEPAVEADQLFEDRNIVEGEDVVGTLRLVGTDTFVRAELAHKIVRVTAAAVLVGAALMAALYYLLWRNVLQPLAELESDALAVSTGERGLMSPAKMRLGAEFENLREALGKMVALLESRYGELHRHETMLSSVLNAVPQAIFWKDRESVYLGGNEAFAKAAGFSDASALVGKTDFDMPWFEEAALFRTTDQHVMAQGKSRDHLIEEMTTAGGKRIWVEAVKTPLRDQSGEIFGILGISEDITERRAKEESLRRQAAFNAMANRILAGLVGNTGAELDEHLKRSLGEIAEFMGTQYAMIIQMDEEGTTWSFTHEWRENGIVSVFSDYQRVTFGERRRWAERLLQEGETIVLNDIDELPEEASSLAEDWKSRGFHSALHVPLRGAGGALRGCMGQFCLTSPPSWSSEDVGRIEILASAIANTLERRQAENALRMSEGRFRSLIEFAPIAIVLSRDGVILYGNEAFLRLFQFADNAAIAGKSLLELAAPEKRGDMEMRIRRRLAGTPISDSYETMGMRTSGERFPFHVDVKTVVLPDGEATVAFLHDLTERRRADALAIESEKLRTVAGLASGVAHEINNPLAGMVQNAQVVLSRLTQETPANMAAAERHGTTFAAIREYIQERDIPGMIETIRASGRQASRIVQNLLAYSRREGPRVVTSISELVERTLDLAANDYELKKGDAWSGVEIVREFDAGVPGVACVPAQIQQVVLNLLRNAVQGMRGNPPGREKRITLRTAREDGFVRMEVEDTGPGVAAEIRSKIFEPFFTTKPEGEGTGLGLFVSYHIVKENHGGEIGVESGAEGGARFVVRLPVRAGEG